jgi:hypothetical protein
MHLACGRDVGKRAESTIYQAAAAFEAIVDWQSPMVPVTGRGQSIQGTCSNVGPSKAWSGSRRRRSGQKVAARRRQDLIWQQHLEASATNAGARQRAFRRSLHIRHVDAGSYNGCESELQALNNPFYNLHRMGIFFTASPRFADLLLVTARRARFRAELADDTSTIVDVQSGRRRPSPKKLSGRSNDGTGGSTAFFPSTSIFLAAT